MFNRQRKRKYIDKPVQGQLMRRVVAYWLLSMYATFCVLAGIPVVMSLLLDASGAPTPAQIVLQTWRTFWPTLFAAALVLPLLLADVVRVSHRFAGPMYRLKNALRDAADGKPVEPVKFRDGDFWCEMADEFNRVNARLQDVATPRS